MSTTVTYEVSTGARGPEGADASVTTANVLATLQGEEGDPERIGTEYLPETVAGSIFRLADTTGLILQPGDLGADASGNPVVHDGATVGGNPLLTGYRRTGSWVGSVAAAIGASTGLLGEVTITDEQAVAGTILRIRGTISGRYSGAIPTGACVGISTIKQRLLTSGIITPSVLTRINHPSVDSATPWTQNIDIRMVLTASGTYAGFHGFIADTTYQPEVISNGVTSGVALLAANNAVMSTLAVVEEGVGEALRLYFSTTSAGSGTGHISYDLEFIFE